MDKEKITEEWGKLPDNRTDGIYARNGFEHTKAYQGRLEFILNKVQEREDEIIQIIRNFKIPDNARILPDGVDVDDEYKESFYNLLIELIIEQIKK